jgi:hypothetical protein
MGAVLSVTAVLAAKGPDPNDVKAGWVGFAVFLALAIAVVLLWLSFRKQLKKINFEEEPDQPAPDSNGSPGNGAPSNGSPRNDAPPATPS